MSTLRCQSMSSFLLVEIFSTAAVAHVVVLLLCIIVGLN